MTTVLYFGDIFGRVGRKAVATVLTSLKSRYRPDFILGNAENLSGGRGVNKKGFNEIMGLGFHCLTSGNHIWDNKDVYSILETDSRLLRPANYPSSEQYPCPGRGYQLIEANGKSLLVINIQGRVFMDAIDCPFHAIDALLKGNLHDSPTFVDLHAEATSEKNSMAWYLNGRVSALVGSHTHIQTADERILSGGTAYITDVGMTGSFDSSIGFSPSDVLRKFLTKRKHHAEMSKNTPGVSCVVIRIRDDNKADSIERIRLLVADTLGNDKDFE